jgi:hypothetical protein
MVLAAKPDQFLALDDRRAILALAGVTLGLTDPVRNRLRGRLELPRQLVRRSP